MQGVVKRFGAVFREAAFIGFASAKPPLTRLSLRSRNPRLLAGRTELRIRCGKLSIADLFVAVRGHRHLLKRLRREPASFVQASPLFPGEVVVRGQHPQPGEWSLGECFYLPQPQEAARRMISSGL